MIIPNHTEPVADQIRKVILTDFAGMMRSTESLTGKFILIAVGIEFLGACLDRQHLNATARSEKRFNIAIQKLFPGKYHHFTKQGSVPNLYTDFRCPVIHLFRTEKSVFLTGRSEAITSGLRHLSYHPDGSLVLVAEDFYDDLASAGKEFIKRTDNG